MDLKLNGASVLITGGSKGIGLATARAFAAEGCHLHLAARTEKDLQTARERIQHDHDVRVRVHPIDLRRGANVHRLADICGDVDILVNNAGAIPGGTIEAIDEDGWRAAWELKVFGYINMMRAYLQRMKARRQGVIVNIIGNAGNQPPAEYAAGVSADAMLEVLTRILGGESLDHGVRVVGVSPGDLMNARGMMFLRRQAEKEWGDPERWQERLADLPGGRAGTSEEIADAVVFLASPRAGYTSGAILTIDGGVSARRAVM
ncbi:MAG: short-chain dehydrogenase/reductase [Desulfobacterales bacterium]|jgi:NAD(P)-dependent dehydrogenase (short-subunit alcohol dehydrogenase family)